MFENSHNKSGRRHKTQIFNNLLAAAMTGSQVYFSSQLDFLQMGEIQLYVIVGPWPLLGWKLLEVIHKYRSLSWVPHSHPTHIQFACFCPIWLPFSSPFLGPILPSPPLPFSLQYSQMCACPAVEALWRWSMLNSPTAQGLAFFTQRRVRATPLLKHILERRWTQLATQAHKAQIAKPHLHSQALPTWA